MSFQKVFSVLKLRNSNDIYFRFGLSKKIILILISSVYLLLSVQSVLYAQSTGEVKTVYIKDGESFDFVFVPAGSFLMGSELSDPDRDASEWISHRVDITKGFWLQKSEVTQDQWQSVMNSNPSYFKNRSDMGDEESPLDNPGDTQKYHSGRGGCPVERVSWLDCEKFIAVLNSKEAGIFRLPTEAEWEYACRAGSQTSYYWGDGIKGDYLWHMDNAYNKPQAVCRKLPNEWGLFDMSGNMAEWCSDWNEKTHDRRGMQISDPAGPEEGEYKIIKDGSWAVRAQYCRSASRSMQKPEAKDMYTGLRLVWQPPENNDK